MRHKRILKSLATGFLVLCASTAFSKTTINVSTWYPPSHPGVIGGFKPFMDYVKDKSNDTIDFKYWQGGALLSAKGTLSGLENGIADIGNMAMTYYPAEFPYFQLIADLALYSDNAPAVTGAVNELLVLDCAPCRKEFLDKGLVYLAANALTPYTMISKVAINSPEDLKNKRFRSPGATWDHWASYVGGTTVDLPSSEMFQALDRGAVDVVLQPSAALKSFSLWDVAKYNTLLHTGIYNASALFVGNQAFWQGLTDEQRRTILNGSALGAMGTTFSYIKNDKDALEQAKEHGIEIIQPDEALKKQLAEFIKADKGNIIKRAKTRYHINDPETLISKYVELLKKWEGIVKETGNDQTKLVKAMQQEIFDKVDPANYGM